VASISSRRLLRPVGFDELGLRRAISDRMLPFLVAAMAVLAAMALAGWVGAASLARHWQQGAASALTVQVARPTEPAAQGGGSRLERVVALLLGTPGVADAHPLTDEELGELLRPWLGNGVERLALPLPAVIAVRLSDPELELDKLAHRLDVAAPGTLVESHGVWIGRLSVLARSLQACAGLALLLVAGVAAAVIAVATRAGLAARREAIEIVHGLGATDSYIASRFAGRATLLAASGGIAGAVVALPVLLTLASMAAPFAGGATEPISPAGILGALPGVLWLTLPGLPAAAAAIGYITAQGTVRRWLRRLP
jgi:cell division transport system permease protein